MAEALDEPVDIFEFAMDDALQLQTTARSVPVVDIKMALSVAAELTTQRGRSSAGGSSAGVSKTCSSAGVSKTCPIRDCPEAIRGKRRFCVRHDRPYENIHRATFPELVKKARKNQDEQGGKKNALEETATFNDEQMAFVTIFGWKAESPWNQELASNVLRDYLDLYSDGLVNKALGKSRGHLPLSTYVESRGTEQSNTILKRGPLWDREMFEARMPGLRGWDVNRREVEWTKLKAMGCLDPDSNPEKMRIPPGMIGEEWAEEATKNFSSRRIDTAKIKGEGLNAAQVNEAVSDCQRGHGFVAAASSIDVHMAVSGNSFTVDPLKLRSGADLMLKAAPQAAAEVRASSPEGSVSAPGSSQRQGRRPAEALEDGSQFKQKKRKTNGDFVMARMEAAGAEETFINKEKTNTWVALLKTVAELHRVPKYVQSDVDYKESELLVKERLKVLLCIMGRELVPKEGDDVVSYMVPEGATEVGTDIDFAKLPQTEATDPSTCHRDLVRQLVKENMRFIDPAHLDMIPTFADLLNNSVRLRACEDFENIHAVSDEAELQRELLGTIRDRLMASVALLKKENDKYTNAFKKAKGEAETKAKEKEHQRLVLHAEALNKKNQPSQSIWSFPC
jgi:hypothetical protein